MLSDIEISQKNVMAPISEIATKIGLTADDIECYGNFKAKVSFKKLRELQQVCENRENRGKLVLVTAITPTKSGEGKSTVVITLADALAKMGKKAIIALREPSLGPCFGVKGGACGGGYAQIVPMEDINLHFTGDIHAVTAANNLMAALIDNHLQQGNSLRLDSRTISWKRCVDLNDRALRNVVVGMGGRLDGVPRESHFQISVASEIMAIVCLSKTISEMKERISRIVIGCDYDKNPVTFGQLGCTGAIATLLKDAIRPNLVQSLEKTPAFVHGGPFANIAHGCNSINATLCALATGDYVVTEAGFAADLGAEKFFDIKCRLNGIEPAAAVLVVTVRALQLHGAGSVERGFENARAHIENLRKFGVPVVVAINKFATDKTSDLQTIKELSESLGAQAIECDGWGSGGDGCKDLAAAVDILCDGVNNFAPLYPLEMPIVQKIEVLTKEIYHAASVEIDSRALKKIAEYEEMGYKDLPICVAKTQNSISHYKSLLGNPAGYVFPVRDVQLYAGAGFVVVFAGDIVDMPGLPKSPSALNIDVDDEGIVSGLF